MIMRPLLLLLQWALFALPGLSFRSSIVQTRRCIGFRLVDQKQSRADNEAEQDDDLSALLTSRLPTSVDDQVRQAVEGLKLASKDGIHRHSVRLLLPVIGATELDDWPGGARQMMEAASPLVERILRGLGGETFSKLLLDASDGVYAVMAQSKEAKDDTCAVLLPSAETIPQVQNIDSQVGPKRDLFLINSQWKRKSDFGGAFSSFFGKGNNEKVDYADSFVPTFSLTNLICEGENIRVLRCYPGPWKVYIRYDKEDGDVDWLLLGTKEFKGNKPGDWDQRPENQQDGGRLFNYGQPSYQEIAQMLLSSAQYTPKNPAERAAAAFNFIKDSL